jgi:hypothetical protein
LALFYFNTNVNLFLITLIIESLKFNVIFLLKNRIYQIAKNVMICKDQNEFLGLTIAGGRDSSSTSFDRIFIKSVIPNSSASRSKKLKYVHFNSIIQFDIIFNI